jgi:hypothetical protein
LWRHHGSHEVGIAHGERLRAVRKLVLQRSRLG